MTNVESRVAQMMASALGCAYLIDSAGSGLSPEELADPVDCLRRVAGCVHVVERWQFDDPVGAWAAIRRLALDRESWARTLLEYPGTAWWFEDVDFARQGWCSIDGTLNDLIAALPPDPVEWRRPQKPSRGWESYAQKPLGNQTTSTVRGPQLTSHLMAYDERSGDYTCRFPLAWWTLRLTENLRVFEVRGPADWHKLCVGYPEVGKDSRTHRPRAGGEDGRLVPNWGAVAEEWDGVHLSLGGLLTTEQNRFETSEGWSMLEFWHAEQAYWLGPLEAEIERQPDFERGMGAPEVYSARFPEFWDEGDRTLLMRVD